MRGVVIAGITGVAVFAVATAAFALVARHPQRGEPVAETPPPLPAPSDHDLPPPMPPPVEKPPPPVPVAVQLPPERDRPDFPDMPTAVPRPDDRPRSSATANGTRLRLEIEARGMSAVTIAKAFERARVPDALFACGVGTGYPDPLFPNSTRYNTDRVKLVIGEHVACR